MQDPLFQLTKEDTTTLDSFFNTSLDLGFNGARPTEQSPLQQNSNIAPDSAEMPSQVVEMLDQIMPEPEVPDMSLSKATSLADRIKLVEKEYNDKPVSIYGKLRDRLLTTANKMRHLK